MLLIKLYRMDIDGFHSCLLDVYKHYFVCKTDMEYHDRTQIIHDFNNLLTRFHSQLDVSSVTSKQITYLYYQLFQIADQLDLSIVCAIFILWLS